MVYQRLAREERYQIQAWDSTGIGIREIARKLSRSPSTICRELRRGRDEGGGYDAGLADARSQALRHRGRPRVRKIRGSTERYVVERLERDWSPEQVAGRMRLEGRGAVSHTTIYRYLERDKAANGELWRHLRILRRKHKDRKRPMWNSRKFLPNRTFIQDRPKVVEARRRLGDYERDTVLGKRGGPVLLTAVDRTSRLLKLGWVPKSTANSIHRETVRILKNQPLHTITNDNGFEFYHHDRTAQALDTDIYFSSSFRSWERGTNENTNGLLRQYFPKKQPIGQLDRRALQWVENRLNNRPRKTLGYLTPREVHRRLRSELLRC